ncbi:hypothetical protein EJ08DRAFT_667085 [Tothia fuscella]|uniref:MARVEL domain-containing protein n=1 Tax=Tothia fuscella TaxID=1048955 RepID=A0A9P4P2E9_9PEZI|nr:hypothetical protein EJ08DRAFT_667085 [Tothia fuscella]
MIPGILFATWRIIEIITLIPIVGMLSWFVNGFQKNNELTPTFILVLFIVSVLAAAWAVGTLITYHRARTAGAFIAFIDLCFVGALIAGVYELRGITKANCANFSTSNNGIYLNLGPFGSVGGQLNNPLHVNVNKSCAMLKAAFALAIMNIIFFFITFLISLWVGHHNKVEYDRPRKHRNERVYTETRHHSSRSPRRSHTSRRSHSHHSRTRRTII